MARRALSASRSADVLNFLAAHPGESFAYAELATRLGVNLASTHSVLMALVECGYLARDPDDRRYSLGPALVALGDAALRANPEIDAARQHLRRLAGRLDVETVAFVRAGTDALCIARAGTPSPDGYSIQVGQRIPLMAPLMPAYVAWSSEEEIERWLVRGGISGAQREEQMQLLSLVRERGLSATIEGEGRRRLGLIMRALTEDPHSESLQDEIDAAIRDLSRQGFQLPREGRAKLRIATMTAPVFDAAGELSLSISLLVYRSDPDGSLFTRLADALLASTRALSRSAPPAPGEAATA